MFFGELLVNQIKRTVCLSRLIAVSDYLSTKSLGTLTMTSRYKDPDCPAVTPPVDAPLPRPTCVANEGVNW